MHELHPALRISGKYTYLLQWSYHYGYSFLPYEMKSKLIFSTAFVKEQKSIYTSQPDLTSMVVVKIEKPDLNGSSQYIH